MLSVSPRVHVIAGVGFPSASQKNAEFPPASVVLFCGRLSILAGSGWKMEKCFEELYLSSGFFFYVAPLKLISRPYCAGSAPNCWRASHDGM